MTALSKLLIHSLNTYKACIMLHNNPSFIINSPTSNSSNKIPGRCMCHVYSAAPPYSLFSHSQFENPDNDAQGQQVHAVVAVLLFYREKSRLKELAWPHFLPPAAQPLVQAIYQPNPLPMFQLTQLVPKFMLPPRFLWGKMGPPH